MVITFPANRRDLSELTPAQLDALYAELEILRDRLGDTLELAELTLLRRSLEATLATLYHRLSLPDGHVVHDWQPNATLDGWHCAFALCPERRTDPLAKS